jgi:hypothetical protein
MVCSLITFDNMPNMIEVGGAHDAKQQAVVESHVDKRER